MKKWFEKTVEYLFVIEFHENLSISPLDGNVEKAGDATIEMDNKFLLIEFKRSSDEECIKSEINKLKNKKDSIEKLRGAQNKFHFIVYGEYDEKNNKISLKSKNYCDYLDSSGDVICVSWEVLNGNAIEQERFLSYLRVLIEEKIKEEIDSGTSSGGKTLNVLNDLANVLVINQDGNVFPLSDFIENIKEFEIIKDLVKKSTGASNSKDMGEPQQIQEKNNSNAQRSKPKFGRC